MSKKTELFDFEGIDDFCLASVEQEHLFNNTPEMRDNNNYNYSEYNLMLRNDGNQPLTFHGNYQSSSAVDLLSSELTSNADSLSSELQSGTESLSSASIMDWLSSDLASTVVLPTSSAPSAVSLPIKQRLNGMLKQKLGIEGRLDTSGTSSPKESFVQLTPEEEKKKLEKQHRNKESARKSRQKKKEDEEKLLKDNRRLTFEKEELQNSVDGLKIIIHEYEEFFAKHECTISPQQDNGDKVCVETGRNKVCGDDANSDAADNAVLETALELMSVYDTKYSQGSESQRKQAILCELRDECPSETVTSATAYVPDRGLTANVGYSFSIQESVVPNTREELKIGYGAIGGKLLAGSCVGSDTQIFSAKSVHAYQPIFHGMPPMSGEVTEANNSSVFMMKSRGSNMIDPWSTDGNGSEVDEDLKLLFPPPVKKFRRE